MSAAISTKGLVKRYGRRRALDGFTLAVPSGATVGLVGCNGSGKTTWMMSVAGFVKPDGGEIDILGRGAFDAGVHGGLLGILPQDSELPPDSRPGELLAQWGMLQGMTRAKAEDASRRLLASFNLADRANASYRSLSHGMRKRLLSAQAFLGDPKVVLLDEPLGGLDPVEADRLRNFILARRARQTMVISSHDLGDIERLCTHVAFVEAGRVVKMTTLRSLTADSGRVVYELAAEPSQEALAAPDEGWAVSASGLRVQVDFDPSRHAAQDVNAYFLPRLLPFGVVSVNSGKTLEDVYLGR